MPGIKLGRNTKCKFRLMVLRKNNPKDVVPMLRLSDRDASLAARSLLVTLRLPGPVILNELVPATIPGEQIDGLSRLLSLINLLANFHKRCAPCDRQNARTSHNSFAIAI